MDRESLLLTTGAILILMYALQVINQQLQSIQKQLSQVKLSPLKSGTLEATGGEDVVIEYASNEPFTITGWIDLKNMQEGDTVVISQSFILADETEYSLFAERTYSGVQSQPLLHITPRQAVKKAKVTLKQTSGTLKKFPFEFYKGGTV